MSIGQAFLEALESRDLYMRALAELENVRKRASRDVEQAHKFSFPAQAPQAPSA